MKLPVGIELLLSLDSLNKEVLIFHANFTQVSFRSYTCLMALETPVQSLLSIIILQNMLNKPPKKLTESFKIKIGFHDVSIWRLVTENLKIEKRTQVQNCKG